jgi:hypothetical protein
MISIFGPYGCIGNDGVTTQTSERCLIRAKPFLLLFFNIRGNFIMFVTFGNRRFDRYSGDQAQNEPL